MNPLVAKQADVILDKLFGSGPLSNTPLRPTAALKLLLFPKRLVVSESPFIVKHKVRLLAPWDRCPCRGWTKSLLASTKAPFSAFLTSLGL